MDAIRSFVLFLYAVLAALVGLAIGALACIGQACAEYIIAGVKVLHADPDDLPGRESVFTRPNGDDPARPNYFYGPGRANLRYVRQIAVSRWRGAAEWWQEAVRGLIIPDAAPVALSAPLGAGLAAGLILALPFAALLVAVVWLTHEMVVDVATTGVRSAATTLRAIDSGILFVRRIQVRCVACFERMPYPAYICPNPEGKHIHQDIRPGRYGVLHRTCDCGARMPTTLLFGTAVKLEAVCPYRDCRHPLEYRPGEVQEIILPIFGSKGAGKTLLLYGIIKTLCEASRPGVRIVTADSVTSERMSDLESDLARDAAVPATTTAPPRAYVVRLRIGRQRRIVQFLDAAGELFYDSQRSAELIYLGAANTFVLAIDPLSINAFWDSLPSAAREQFAADRSVAPHPELAFQQTAERIAEMASPRAQHRLAIVFSRADLLGTKYGPGTGDGAEIREWAAHDLGLTGLLRQAKSQFREVAFFHTAPFGSGEDTLSPLAHWIMRAEGITPQASIPRAAPD